MNIHKTWTPEDESRLINMYEASDLSIREIAEEIGRSHTSAQARIAQLRARNRISSEPRRLPAVPDDIRNRVLEMYNSGSRYMDIVRETGQSYNRVNTIINKYRTENGMRKVRASTDTPDGPRRSTGSSALDSALDTLRKELGVLKLQQASIAEKVARLRRTIAAVENVTR